MSQPKNLSGPRIYLLHNLLVHHRFYLALSVDGRIILACVHGSWSNNTHFGGLAVSAIWNFDVRVFLLYELDELRGSWSLISRFWTWSISLLGSRVSLF